MTLVQESYLIHLLNQCDAFSTRQEKQSKQAVIKRLDEIYKILKRNVRQTFIKFSLDVIVRFSQISVQIQEKLKYAEQFVQLFFERIESSSQFYIRQLLVKAKVIAFNGHKKQLKGQEIIQTLKQSISYIIKSLDLISGGSQQNVPKGKQQKGSSGGDSSKFRYGFLVYNASTCLYKITRFMLKNSWQKNFTQIFERIYKLFEQLDEPDHNWRSRFSLILFQCLYDNEKKPDAFKVLDLLWEKTKTKNCDFQDSLFRLRIHLTKENNALAAIIKKDIQTNPGSQWGVLEVLQRIKSGYIPEPQVQKELMTVVNTIYDGVLSSSSEQTSTTLSPIKQERLAQAGRLALKYNLLAIATPITTFLTKARQPNQKAMVLNQYNKAELLIKKKGEFIDKKTGMMMSPQQIKALQVQYRKQALKILQKVMIINRKLDNAQLIYQGAVLVWNISLPFMCPQYKNSIIKAFQISSQLLEQIDSIDHDLRTKMHLQLAKAHFGNQAMFVQVQSNVMKAIKLDHSIAISKLQYKFQPEQDPSLYQRPYQRYLQDFRQKILIKTMQNIEPTPLDVVTQDLWNVAQQKSQTTRIDILQKCLRVLINHEEDQFKVNQQQMLVQQEIKVKKIQFERNKLRLYKRKKLLAAQIAQFSFQWQLNDFSKKACEFVLSDTWQGKNSIQLIIVQSKCCYFMAQMKIDELNQMNFQLPFEQAITINEQQNLDKLTETEQKKKQVKQRKQQIFEYLKKGLQLAESIQQHWLVFNGAIYLWNNCLHIFRNPSNDSKLKSQLVSLLQKFFESMKKSLSEIQAKSIVYYDLDNKIQTFANIGLVYARLRQLQKKTQEVLKICESLLNTSLSPHTRKLINGIKARVQKSGNVKQADPKKGCKQVSKSSNTNDSFVLQILTQLQIIQNTTNKSQTQNLLKKCFQNLQTWKPKEQDETQLQLHAQLWVRLARLSLNQNTIQMFKYSLRCCEYALGHFERKQKQKQLNNQGTKTAMSLNNDLGSIPVNRLRWYSLAQFLYSQSLIRIVNPDTQQLQSVYKLRFTALERAVEAAYKGYKCNINILVLDAAKQVWNICSKLQQIQANRFKLLKPIKTTLYYLKQMKEDSEVDLILLLSELYFKTCFQNNQFKAGEDMVDMLLALVPKNLQKSLWEAKMVFMSKQGKNQLHAISSMKQADPSLQAKLWVKLARVSVNPSKQHTAYNKALDILKKQNSVQIVEVLMQYAEWQIRIGKQNIESVSSTLLLAADYLIDIEFGQQDDEQIDDDKNTVFSRSTRGKKSVISKSAKSSFRQKTKKGVEKKGPMSIKSKNSGLSRMNKSGRITKTIKSKNTKSIFSQKQEDPNPESLNCLHFERLFRIHTTLAMISSQPQNRIRYALDAKQFLIKIYQLSLKTLNELHQNSTKFAQKSQKKEDLKKLQLPKSSEEWIKFDLPKQFVQRIKNLQNYNFMGSFIFQKPELTFTYIEHLINIFQLYGLSLHTLPAYFFSRYISKYLIENQRLYTLCELKLKRMLSQVKFSQQYINQIQINFADQKVSQQEYKQQIIKAQGCKTIQKDSNMLFQDSAPPNLIKQFSNYIIWIKMGEVFIDFGEISLAKHLLAQAQAPVKILSDTQNLSKIYKCLSQVSYIEGEFAASMDYCLISNKLCKNTSQWHLVILQTCKNLLNLKKFQNLKKYLHQINQTISELIEQSKEQSKQKPNFQTEVIQMKDILLLVDMLKIQSKFNEILFQENSQENVSQLQKHLIKLKEQSLLNETLIKGNLVHFNLFKKITESIFKLYQNGGGSDCIDLNFNIFNTTFDVLTKIQKILIQIGKYCFIGGSDYYSNTLSIIHKEIRFLIVQGYEIKQLLGQKNSYVNSQQIDQVRELGLDYQPLKKYLNTLTIQIHKKMSPIPTNLQPCESAIAILQNLRPNISSDSYEYVQWFSHYTLCQTLRAISKKQLQAIWMKIDNLQNSTSQYASLSIQNSQDFIQQCEPKLVNYIQDIFCHKNSQRGYYSLLNNKGLQFPNKFFQYLSKYQHSCYTQFVIQTLKSKFSSTHRFSSGQRIIENIDLRKQFKQKILSNDIVNAYTQFPTYKQCLGMLPFNSIIINLQLSNTKSEMYFSCLINNGAQDKKYLVKKKQLMKMDVKLILSMKQIINKVKKSMIKCPFEDQSKIDEVIQENQDQLVSFEKKFVQFNKWWLDQIVYLLNQPKEVSQQVVDPKEKDKKGAKDQKKGGKDQVSSYKCTLPPTPSGIQSITFLLDQFLYILPFEHLVGLENVPAVSKDSSLFYMCRKLQKLNYQAQLNNSLGFGADKGKYLGFDYKDQEANFSSMLPQINKSGIKLQGFGSSTKRVPSPGDFINYAAEPGFLHIYGSINYLNRIKLPNLLTMLPTVKASLMILTDNLNYRKDILNKFIILTDGFLTPTQQQEEVLVLCANLLNLTLIKNRWTQKQQNMMKMIKQWYKKLGQGLYVGCIGRQILNRQINQQIQQASKKQELFKKMLSFVHGPAVLRM